MNVQNKLNLRMTEKYKKKDIKFSQIENRCKLDILTVYGFMRFFVIWYIVRKIKCNHFKNLLQLLIYLLSRGVVKILFKEIKNGIIIKIGRIRKPLQARYANGLQTCAIFRYMK